MKLLICMLCVPSFSGCICQTMVATQSGSYLSVGTYSKNFCDAFSSVVNQAALSAITSPVAGLYAERGYLLKELSSYKAVAALPFKKGGAALVADYNGSKDYNESHLALAYGRQLGEKIALGVQVNYYHINTAGFAPVSFFNVEAGTIFKLTETLVAGFHLYNPGAILHKTNDPDKLPAGVSAGMGYEASEQFLLAIRVNKTEDLDPELVVSFEYRFMKSFFIRAGFSTLTANTFAGTGLQLKHFRVDFCGRSHPQLGFTPALLLLFNLHKNAAEQ